MVGAVFEGEDVFGAVEWALKRERRKGCCGGAEDKKGKEGESGGSVKVPAARSMGGLVPMSARP